MGYLIGDDHALATAIARRFHGHYLILSDFGALCRVVWILWNIRRFDPHAGIVFREYEQYFTHHIHIP